MIGKIVRLLLGMIMPIIVSSYLVVMGMTLLLMMGAKSLALPVIQERLIYGFIAMFIYVDYFIGLLFIVSALWYSVMVEYVLQRYINSYWYTLPIGSFYYGMFITLYCFAQSFKLFDTVFFGVIGLLTGFLVTWLLRYLYNKSSKNKIINA